MKENIQGKYFGLEIEGVRVFELSVIKRGELEVYLSLILMT